MRKRPFLPISLTLCLCCVATLLPAKETRTLDLKALRGEGVKVLDDFAGDVDSHGVLATYRLALPEFEAGVHYRGGWWPAGGNRVYGEIVDGDSILEVREGGMFLLLRIGEDDYLAALPMVCEKAYAWMHSDGKSLLLKLGTHGTAAVRGDLPLLAWARTGNPYESCYKAWKKALSCPALKGGTRMREQKPYPEPFRYLGWCSWEQYKNGITETNMVQTMRGIMDSGLPIRFFLIDDGHFDRQSLKPNEKFPNGYKPFTDLRSPDKIKWVGVWYAFLGNSHGVRAPGKMDDLKEWMYECKARALLPKPTAEAARAFYDYVLDRSVRDDVDFLKVDFQTDALPFYAGTPHGNPLKGLPPDNSDACGNPMEAASNLAKVFQDVVERRMNGLINCNWHNAVSLFFSGDSVVGRCSEDYSLGKLGPAVGHLYHSYAATPWLGQIAWGDHDMFHSNDPVAGRMMAVSKALSGAPVYLSDAASDFDANVVRPLCFEDGLLLRPLAPSAPLPDSLFARKEEERLYKAAAPLPGNCAAIVVYNFAGGNGKMTDTWRTAITVEDYRQVSGMIQPYAGPWEAPGEGLFVYDWYRGEGQILKPGGYDVEIAGFGDRLVQLSPIRHGWSAIGRTDKYLSAAAMRVVSSSPERLEIELLESGPFAVYSRRGAPKAKGITFTDAGGGLYKADMPVTKGSNRITIRRYAAQSLAAMKRFRQTGEPAF